MIKVFIPFDEEFKKYENECKELYEKLKDKICDTNSFNFIRDNTFFYMFIDEYGLIGAIYYFLDKDNKLFLNGFSKRKKFEKNLQSLKLSIGWFVDDIFAEAQNRASALCLLRCGFERLKDNLFVYKKSK